MSTIETKSIPIDKVIVHLRKNGTDLIYIYTPFPYPYLLKTYKKENLVLVFEASYDTGINYVRNNFCIEPEIMNDR